MKRITHLVLIGLMFGEALASVAVGGSDHVSGIDVEFALQKVEEGSPVAMSMKETHQWLYKIERFIEGRQVAWENRGKQGLYIPTQQQQGRLRGCATLLPGQYRIRSAGSIQYPYECEAEFTVSATATGGVQSIVLSHRPKERAKGRLRVVDAASGAPEDGLVIRLATNNTELGVLQRWESSDGPAEAIVPTDSLTTSPDGAVEFWYWSKCDRLVMAIDDHRYVRHPMRLTEAFSSEDLKNGATWAIRERSIVAKIALYLRSEVGGSIPCSEHAMSAMLPIGESPSEWRLSVYDIQSTESGEMLNNLVVEEGRFVPREGAFVYRDLRTEQRYLLSDKVRADKRTTKVTVLDGGGQIFELRNGTVYLGTITAAVSEVSGKLRGKESSVILTGRIQEAAGGMPVTNANIQLTGERGSASVLSDTNGKFRCEAEAGHYWVRVSAKGYNEWTNRINVVHGETNSLDVNVQSLRKLVVRIVCENNKVPRRGELAVYHDAKAGPYATEDSTIGTSTVFYGVPDGNLLVVYRGACEAVDKRGWAIGRYVTGVLELKLTGGLNLSNDLVVAEARAVTPVVDDEGLGLTECTMIARADWRGMSIPLGRGRWDRADLSLGELLVPCSGEYLVEIVIPTGDAENGFAGGVSYSGGRVKIEGATDSVRIVVDSKSKRKFRRPL